MRDGQEKVGKFTDNAIFATAAKDGKSTHRQVELGIDRESIVSYRAKVKADEIGLIRTRIAASADGHLSGAAGLIIKSPADRLTDDDYKAFRAKVNHATSLARVDSDLAQLEKQYRKQVVTVRDVDPYAEGSPHSWIHDYLAAADQSGDHRAAEPNYDERLQRHSRIVAGHVDKRTAYGQAMERAYCGEHRQVSAYEHERVDGKRVNEWRGLVTGGGASASASGGGAAAFVTPIFLWDAFAVYRSAQRVFADQLNKSYTLPPWGMQAYIPAWTSGTTVATDTEGSATAEGDPVSGFQSGAIVQKAGQVTLSRAVTDRAGPGMSGDRTVFLQLKDTLGSQINAYALNQAMPNSQTVSNSGSFSVTDLSGGGVGTGLLNDIRKAKNSTHDTLGTRIRSTHLFTTGDLLDYVTAYADAQGQPMFHPSHSDNPPARTAANPDGDGWTGFVISGLAAYADDSVPTTTTTPLCQIIVTRPCEIALLESEPVFSVYPQTLAGSLEDIVVAREYCGCIARYPSAVATIGGVAYTASQFV